MMRVQLHNSILAIFLQHITGGFTSHKQIKY